MKAVFWNLKNKFENVELILDYCARENIDMLFIIEAPSQLPTELRGFRLLEHVGYSSDIQVIFKPECNIYFAREKKRYCIIDIDNKLNIVVAHLNSDMYSNGKNARQSDIEAMLEELKIEESKHNNQNSMIIGDLNESLFSDNMVSWSGLNARYFKFMLKNGQICIHENKKDLFYNPMLYLYKDNLNCNSAKGTYYYNNEIGWDCKDHILLKKSLADGFSEEKVKIIDNIYGKKLVKNNVPILSDHLPIYFEIEERIK